MFNLGLFMMPIHPAGKDLGSSLREDEELVLLADKLNFSESWMGEHYSSSGEPVPSPLIFNSMFGVVVKTPINSLANVPELPKLSSKFFLECSEPSPLPYTK